MPVSGSQKRLARLEKGHFFEFPSSKLGVLKESNVAVGFEELNSRLASDGYVFLRQCLNREKVLTAKEAVLEYMQLQERDQKIFENRKQGVLDVHCGRHCVPHMEGVNDITKSAAVQAVLESDELFEVFRGLFRGPAKSFDYKWLRAMYMEGFTGAHLDSVYMSRGTKKTLTCWIPFDDVPIEVGGLAISPGSNHTPSFAKLRQTYGEVDLDALGFRGSGWFSEDAEEMTQRFGARWATADFRAGDVLIFTLHTAHMSLTNQTQTARISCDTRWYPADEIPDPRFTGQTPEVSSKYGDHDPASEGVTIDILKEQWGFQ